MNKFASTRINQIKQLQALEDIVVELQRKYASELVEYNKYAGSKYFKGLTTLASLGSMGLGGGLGYNTVMSNNPDADVTKASTGILLGALGGGLGSKLGKLSGLLTFNKNAKLIRQLLGGGLGSVLSQTHINNYTT